MGTHIKKRLSKRQTMQTKHKVYRKAHEKARKERKAARDATHAGKKKTRKDPGVPNLWPFKEELERKMQQSEDMRRAPVANNKAQKKQRARSLADLERDASIRAGHYAIKVDNNDDGYGTMPGVSDGSRKAYYKEFRKVVSQADVILEVLDARDPLGSRCTQIEQLVMESGTNKKVVLVLNKIDLVPRDVAEKWLKYLRNQLPTIAFKASTQTQRAHLGHSKIDTSVASQDLLSSSECLGAETLVKLLKNYCRSLDIKTSITVGLVGFPNVGKSSIINSLKRTKAVGVGATPGFTKTAQEIHLDKNIKLLDSPGIVFASGGNPADVILRNAIKAEQLDDPISPVNVILGRCGVEQAMQLYSVPSFSDVNEFLAHLAVRIGKLKKGGVPNVDAAAKCVLQDWHNGKISFFTEPPNVLAEPTHVGAQVVQQWSNEFKLSEVMDEENAALLNGVRDRGQMGPGVVALSNGSDHAVTIDMDDDHDMNSGDESYSDHEMEDDDDNAMSGVEMDDDDECDSLPVQPAPGAKAAFLSKKSTQKIRSQQAIVTPTTTQRKNQRRVMFTEEEETLNPQVNLNAKRSQKAARKQARRNQ